MIAITAAFALAGCGHRHHAHAKAHHGCDAKPQQPAQQPAAQQPAQVIVVAPASQPEPAAEPR
jgi:hypothetical protein